MKKLSTTNFVSADNKIYFIEETVGIFGRISPESGEVKFYDNTPSEIMGKSSFSAVLISNVNEILIICNKGKKIVKFDCKTESFSEMITTDELAGMVPSWAGYVRYQNYIYLFSRENGNYIQYDIINKTISKSNTEIKDKICWCCNDGEKIYFINWEMNRIYYFDAETKGLEECKVAFKSDESMSRSSLPLHTMVYDEGYIFFVYSRNIYRFEIKSKKLELFYSRTEDDNGARIIIYSKWIIVPPYAGDEIVIIDKDNISVQKVLKISNKKILYDKASEYSKTGIPCCIDDIIYFPLILTNGFIKIKPDEKKLAFLEFDVNEASLIETMKVVMSTNTMITESSLMNLLDYLNILMN